MAWNPRDIQGLTNNPLSLESVGEPIRNYLEDEATKVLAKLLQQHTQADSIASALRESLEPMFNKFQTTQQPLGFNISDVAAKFIPAIEAALPFAVNQRQNLDTNALRGFIRATSTAGDILGPQWVSQMNTQMVQMAEAGLPFSQASSFVTQQAAQTLFTRRPLEAARRFMYGHLPEGYLEAGGAATAGMGQSIRAILHGTKNMREIATELPVSDSVRDFMSSDYESALAKTTEYLEVLTKNFDGISKELEAAVQAGDTKKAAELKRQMSSLGKEIVETTKTINDIEKEQEKKRKESLQQLGSALSPIGRHAEGALMNPVVGLLKESISVGMNTANAVSNLLSTNEGGGGSSGLATKAGTAALAGFGLRGLLSRIGGWAVAGGEALGPTGMAIGAAAGMITAGGIYYQRRKHAQQEQEAAENMAKLHQFYAQRGVPEEQMGKAAQATQEFTRSILDAKGSLTDFGKQLLGAGSVVGGIAAADLLMNGPEGMVEQGAALAAGGLAAAVNFGVGAINIGQQHLGSAWAGATGLNIEQYKRIAGGQTIAGYLQGGVLNTEALRLGFSINDISRGYEVMQRGMPVGNLSSQRMETLLEENAKMARAFGMRLEETMQTTTTARRTFGTANPAQIGGYIAALGADRSGNFVSAFSKSLTDAFLEASRQMMMQGVAPESAMAGFGTIRNIFMNQNQPQYLQTLFETNPQAATSFVGNVGGMLRQGAAGSNPWALGLGLRGGLTIHEMARGGPEAVLGMMNEFMGELPLGGALKGGKLQFQAREQLSMLAAQLGMNPDVLIGYAEAYSRGDVTRAQQQFRQQYATGAVWEKGLTPEGLHRSPYEENIAVLRKTMGELAIAAEGAQGPITRLNTAILKLTTAVVSKTNLIIKELSELTGLDIQATGVTAKGTSKPPVTEKKTTAPEEHSVHSEAADKFRSQGGFLPGHFGVPQPHTTSQPTFLTESTPNSRTILYIDGSVHIAQEAPNYNPEEK